MSYGILLTSSISDHYSSSHIDESPDIPEALKSFAKEKGMFPFRKTRKTKKNPKG